MHCRKVPWRQLRSATAKTSSLQTFSVCVTVEPFGKRIDSGGFFGVGDLHQAQFRPIGVLAHEFGVNRNEFRLGETLAQGSQFVGRRYQIMYFHIVFLAWSGVPLAELLLHVSVRWLDKAPRFPC